MALVCQCPTCGLFVMSPPEASAEDEVRCPHCSAAFTLGNAAEVSLPRLIRVQQKRQMPDANMHDTVEGVPWALWAELIVDETSLTDEVLSEKPPQVTSPEVHVIDFETSDEGSFLATVTPGSESSSVHDDDYLLDFVIEGEEASKIISTRELQLEVETTAIQEGTESEKERAFDLAFDETLLEEDDTGEASDMFDFEAEAGELGPDEFSFEPPRPFEGEGQAAQSTAVLVATQEQRPLPVASVRDPMASIRRTRKRKSPTARALLVGVIGLVFLGSGYYALNFFGGSEYNYLGIPLPGCPHTFGEEVEVAAVPDESSREAVLVRRNQSTVRRNRSSSEPVTTYRPVSEGNSSTSGRTSALDNGRPARSGELYIDPDLFIPNLNMDRLRAKFRLPQGEVGLHYHPLFDVRELEATLHATHEEFGCAECKSTGYLITPKGKKIECSYCMGEPANIMSTTGYRYFCQLGQVITLFADDSPRAVQAKQDVRDLLKKVVATPIGYDELGKLGQLKLDNQLHPYEGIMIAGLVRVVKPDNGLYGAVIGLPDSEQKVTVISNRPFDFTAGDRVVLLGSVIFEPNKNITGYKGDKPWVIWYGDSIMVPGSSRK